MSTVWIVILSVLGGIVLTILFLFFYSALVLLGKAERSANKSHSIKESYTDMLLLMFDVSKQFNNEPFMEDMRKEWGKAFGEFLKANTNIAKAMGIELICVEDKNNGTEKETD